MTILAGILFIGLAGVVAAVYLAIVLMRRR
jgi:hypothetical protein